MSRTRDFSFAAAGVAVFAALLLSAQPAAAEPPSGGPTEFAQPEATTTTTATTTAPPEPKPNVDLPDLDLAVEQPTTDPTGPSEPSEPVEPESAGAPEPTLTRGPAIPTDPPATQPGTIPTPDRIDTGAGGSAPTPQAPTWLFWVVPGMALLTLGAGLSGWWLARSEQDRR